MHGYIAKSIENDPKIDHKTSRSWTSFKVLSSEFKAYAFAIKDQEIATKYIKAKRRKEIHQTPSRIQNADFVKVLMRTIFT